MKTNQKRFFLMLLLTIITNTLVFAQTSELETQFNLGNQLLEQKDYDGAIRAFSECLRLDPQQSVCYANRGAAYQRKSNFSQAIDDYTKAIKLSPKAIYYNGRAISYTRQKLYDLAIADLKTSLKINPEDAAVKTLLEQVTDLAVKIKQYDALKGLYDAIKTVPGNTPTADDHYKRGKEQSEKGGVAASVEAIESFTECLRLKPDFADCYFYRGRAYIQVSQYEKAVADFTEAIKLQPQNAEYYQRRANTYNLWLKKYDAAIADYSEAIKINPKDSSSYMDRGWVWKSKKDYQKALDDFTQAIKLESSISSKKVLYGVRASLYSDELKNYAASIADYTEMIKIAPQDWISYANRGFVHLKNKNYEKAVADYTEALKLGATLTASMHEYRARAYCGLGKRALAMADERKVIEAGAKVEFPCQLVR